MKRSRTSKVYRVRKAWVAVLWTLMLMRSSFRRDRSRRSSTSMWHSVMKTRSVQTKTHNLKKESYHKSKVAKISWAGKKAAASMIFLMLNLIYTPMQSQRIWIRKKANTSLKPRRRHPIQRRASKTDQWVVMLVLLTWDSHWGITSRLRARRIWRSRLPITPVRIDQIIQALRKGCWCPELI